MVAQLRAQQSDAVLFGQLAVIDGFVLVQRACHAEQFVQYALVHVRALAQVQSGQMEAKNLHSLNQFVQTQAGNGAAFVFSQGVGNDLQISLEFLRVCVGWGGVSGAIGQVAAQQVLRCGRHTGVQMNKAAAIRFVYTVWRRVLAAGRQGRQVFADTVQCVGYGDFCTQQTNLLQIVLQRACRLTQHRLFNRFRAHIGVAIAVTANPAAHAQKGG